MALQYFLVQELVKEGRFSIQYVKTEDQLVDIRTKHLSKHRHRYLLRLISEFRFRNGEFFTINNGQKGYSSTRSHKTPKQGRGVLSVGTPLALVAPGMRIGFFGVYDMEGMGEFISLCSTLAYFLRKTIMYSIISCMYRVEGECQEIDTQYLCLVNASWHGVCRCAQDTTPRTGVIRKPIPYHIWCSRRTSGVISNVD